MSDTDDTDTTALETYDEPDTDLETTRDERSGAMSGPNEYDPMELYELQRHRNGDETVVMLCAFGKGFQALAIDIDAGGQLLEIDEIGDADDRETAVGMCEYWLQANPDGVLGGEPEDGGGVLENLGFGGDGGLLGGGES